MGDFFCPHLFSKWPMPFQEMERAIFLKGMGYFQLSSAPLLLK